jgi:primosomal protein N' (replication factor Y) (superfamily II helicase)
MPIFAEVAIYQSPLRRTFHYHVPASLPVRVGCLVEVSFRTGLSQGIVIALSEESPVPHTKGIQDLVFAEPVLTKHQIALAYALSTQTFSPLSACLWLMLPPGLAKRGTMLYQLISMPPNTPDSALAVLSLLQQRGPLRAAQIDHALPKVRWREALRPLIISGYVQTEAMLPDPEVKAKTIRRAWLNVQPDALEQALASLARSPKQAEVLRLLSQYGALPISEIIEQTGANNSSLKRLAEKALIRIEEEESLRDPLAGREHPEQIPPPLTEGQTTCWAPIEDALTKHRYGAFLLHGVTGSGKTEIYLRAIQTALQQGRQAIMLVPEIALVAPMVARFAARFPKGLAVLHSALTEGERYDTWRRALRGEIDVVIGPRSALFLPLSQVGVIILDEEHDDSYKQGPPLPPPYYHARQAALALANITDGVAVLGSATPDISTVFQAGRDAITYLRLPARVIVPADGGLAQDGQMPPVQVIDMRAELVAGNTSMFSRALMNTLAETLSRDEQTMLFLNRRGNASCVLCRDCGYVCRCPNCDIPLTFHQQENQLVCHYCNHHEPSPSTCPQCKSKKIRFLGAGTAALEEAVQKAFPNATTLRWDRDTAPDRAAHEAIWETFAHGQANILVGTQMIVKGLDLPRVTLVGIMLADTALGLPDYRAGERAFQLLTQAAGRAGRGWRGGQTILQTYQPDHYAIKAASNHDYGQFYRQEISYRRHLGYPPYKRLVRVLCRHERSAQAENDAQTAAAALQEQIQRHTMTATSLIGPAPAFFAKVDGVYHWHVLARTTDPHKLLEGFEIKPGWVVDIDPVDVL